MGEALPGSRSTDAILFVRQGHVLGRGQELMGHAPIHERGIQFGKRPVMAKAERIRYVDATTHIHHVIDQSLQRQRIGYVTGDPIDQKALRV